MLIRPRGPRPCSNQQRYHQLASPSRDCPAGPCLRPLQASSLTLQSFKMRFNVLHTLLSASVLGFATLVAGLGTSCSAPVTSGTAAPGDPFWMEQIKHQGTSPFNSNPSGYQVFRNVMVRPGETSCGACQLYTSLLYIGY